MFRILLVLTAAAITTLQAQAEVSPKATVLIHATIIDSTGAPAQSGMTLVVDGRRITALGKDESVPFPTNAQVIEAKGKFVIPGLWDMHVHLSYTKASALPALVANGVTGVRVDNALLMSFEDLNAGCRFGIPNPHRAVMRRRKNVSLVRTPGHGPNRVRVSGKYPQAFARLRIPEPNITSAGKEPTLVRMPNQTLDMGSRPIDHPQAAPGVDLPEPDCPVPAAR